jgi:hypothetical protein
MFGKEKNKKNNNTTNNANKELIESTKNMKEQNNKNNRREKSKATIPLNPSYKPNDYNESNYQQIEEENKYYQQQIQCQEQLNIQLLLRRQKNYNNTFKNCYDTMKLYLNNPSNINKGNFLWNLDCCCSMVSLWKKEYPEYIPQFSKQFNKEATIKEINQYIQHFKNKNDIEHLKIFNKFYKLLNNERQDMEDDKAVLNHFPYIQPNENNVISSANNLMNIQRKIANKTETEEFYGFPDYDVDDKIKHLRKKE